MMKSKVITLRNAKNVTTRNDPDGRSRLNVDVFTGNVIVTDFGDETGRNLEYTKR